MQTAMRLYRRSTLLILRFCVYSTPAPEKLLELIDPEKERDQAFYQERGDAWLDLLTMAQCPFTGAGMNLWKVQTQEAQLKRAAKFLTERGVKVKGHPLCWHTVSADWLMDYDNKTILDRQLSRIDRDVRAFRGLIDIWDVINEVVIMPVFPLGPLVFRPTSIRATRAGNGWRMSWSASLSFSCRCTSQRTR